MPMTPEKQKLVDELKGLMETNNLSIYKAAQLMEVAYTSAHNLIKKGIGQVGNEKLQLAIDKIKGGK